MDCAAGDAVASGDCGEGDFVGKIAELEGCVGAAVDASEVDLFGVGFFQGGAGLDPACTSKICLCNGVY